MHSKRVLYVAALAIAIGFVAWARHSSANTPVSSPTTSAIAPALKLATGTLKLEGTGQAIDSASAAKLLPLWQLLAQLEGSSSTAPQEITVVVEEIKLNMTSAQLSAIDELSVSEAASGSASPGATVGASSTQSASSPSSPMLGGDMAPGGMLMDGGGPMRPGGPQSGSTGKSSTAAASAASSVFQQVIQLLQAKLQSE